MGIAFLRMFKKRDASQPAVVAEPKWGETRIVRTEHAGGDVYFTVERFGWTGITSGSRYHDWTTFLFRHGVGPIKYPTLAAAQAALDARIKSDAAEKIVSSDVVWPTPNPGDAP